ncbi:MAG: VOC family protein [Candidatus Rokubacteria bacterium]|nr:VOC family protein [Candidatus Rokubacteria bacterium]
MPPAIDHLVIVVRDLETAIASYRELGFTVVPGGRHPVGTHNALIALEDGAYVELIAFLEPDRPQTHRWWSPLQEGGGLVDFCMGTADLEADVRALRTAGVDIDDPRPLTRTRPDGYVLRWVLAIPREGHRGVAPFLIRDDTPRSERVPGATAHANQVTGLGPLTIAVRDLGEVSRWYRSLLGQAGSEGRRDDLGATVLRFRVGPHRLEFAIPEGRDSPLAAFLQQRGPGPYAATLTTRTGVGRRLDERATHGARLSLI